MSTATELIYNLHTYQEAMAHTVNLNYDQLVDCLWLKIPDEFSRWNHFRGMMETPVTQSSQDRSCAVARSDMRPWLQVYTCGLNLSPGFHLYRFIFTENDTGAVSALYFAYNMQSSEIDKPYIYMKRLEGPTDGCSVCEQIISG